jgi:hypothetical protein
MLTAEEQERVDIWSDSPSFGRWFVYFLSNPQRIIDYMAANCSTSTVGGNNITGWLERDAFGPYMDVEVDSNGTDAIWMMFLDAFFASSSCSLLVAGSAID